MLLASAVPGLGPRAGAIGAVARDRRRLAGQPHGRDVPLRAARLAGDVVHRHDSAASSGSSSRCVCSATSAASSPANANASAPTCSASRTGRPSCDWRPRARGGAACTPRHRPSESSRMSAADWDRMKAAFHAAIEMPAADRPAFLDVACAGDPSLRSEVDALLADADDADCPIERQAEQIRGWLGGTVAPGTRVGAYEIVRELGRGGMGTVLLARRADGHYSHDVALKMIRHMVSAPDLESRFRRERQILASLAHANIARLLDGGVTAEGEPFLVMEYVDGEPILAFAARHELDGAGADRPVPAGLPRRRLRSLQARGPSRYQALQYPHDGRRRAEARRLRTRQDSRRHARRRARADAGRLPAHSRRPYASPSRSSATTCRRRPTSTRWASSSMNCSPARRRSISARAASRTSSASSRPSIPPGRATPCAAGPCSRRDPQLRNWPATSTTSS